MKFLYFKEGKKMLTKKKKIFILCGMVVLLGVTGFLNYKLNSQTAKTETANTTTVSASFFETYKVERSEARESELAILNGIIENQGVSASDKTSAIDSKTALAEKMEKELILEGLIKAKGFTDAVVTIGSNYYNVIVKNADELTTDQVAQILSIVTSETGCKASNVKIISMD